MTTVVLCNFGGPTTADEVEPFLRRLFEDPFIIRYPLKPAIRAWIARTIARRRAPKAKAEYAEIGFSPINRFTDIQARHLDALLQQRQPGTRVLVCNRYTAPTADEVVAQLDPDKMGRLFLITLYPHLCHSTTVSSLRDFDLAVQRRFGERRIASTRIFSWWHLPRYLAHGEAALRKSLQDLLARTGTDPVTILFSAHGIPKRYDVRGDPYVTEIQAHYQELAGRVNPWLATYEGGKHAARCHWQLSFQSRVGPVEWMRPYTDETLTKLGRERGGALLMVPISFTSDHIETLWEMDDTYQKLAKASGFREYARVQPPNDDPELAQCLNELLIHHGF